MKNTRITLISDVLPDDRFPGGQVLRKIFTHLDTPPVDVIWINQSCLDPPRDAGGLFRVVREYRFDPPGRLGRVVERLAGFLGPASRAALGLRAIHASMQCAYVGLSAALLNWRLGAAVTWCCLQGEKLTAVFWIVSWFARGRMILHQWDPLSWWMGHRNHRAGVVRLMSWLLEGIHRRSRLSLVPSEEWKQMLAAKGIPAHRIDNIFLDSETGFCSAARVCTPGKVNAVFLGQLYASAELERCLDAVVRAAGRLGRGVVLHSFGPGRPFSWPGVEIRHYGFRPRGDLVAAAAKWDVALLPYPSSEKHRETARLSFPSKSRVYLAAGLPIIAYAPADSSVERFFSRHYRPYYVNAMGQDDISGFLARCMADGPGAIEERRTHAAAVAGNWFSVRAELRPLADALGLNTRNDGHDAGQSETGE